MADSRKTDTKRRAAKKEDGSSEWECAICKSPPEQPKLLPCTHTFCQVCLEGVVRTQNDRGSFPCPECRKRIKLPPNGVAGFNYNRYIMMDEPALKRAREEKALCENHPEEEERRIELYCLECDICFCWKCKASDHLHHVTEELKETVERNKGKVAEWKDKLKDDIDQIKAIADKYRKEHKAIRDKSDVVRKDIEGRYEMLCDMAEKYREEALFSLDTATASAESELPVDDIEKTVDDLERLHKRMEDLCISSGDPSRMPTSAATIHKDFASKTAMALRVRDRSTAAESHILRPVLCYSASPDLAAQTSRNFLGTVNRMHMQVVPSAMKLKLMFHSEKGRQYDIYSLLPIRGQVVVAYDTNPAQDPPQIPPQKYRQTGLLEPWPNCSTKGRTSFTMTGDRTLKDVTQATGKFRSYAKSQRQCILENNLNGSATVFKKVDEQDSMDSRLQYLNLGSDSSDPSMTKLTVVQCGPHRSFDIHATQPIIAIVEEGPASRSVIVFFNGERKPYESPIQPYLPSDVCFYKLNGRDVLLIADELNDTVHVVDIQTWKFQQYLAPGCPLVIQPTALGVDINTGQLWVACRGGALLECEP